MKRYSIGAVSSGCGKTTLTMGLLRLYMRKGLIVQPYKVGPDFVDPEFHSKITGRPARNLDSFLSGDADTLRRLFLRAGQEADLAIIEGVMGLFDGASSDRDDNSTAGISKMLDCPVLLCVDGQAASTSVAAVVQGFYNFDPGLRFLGVVVNKVSSEGHYRLIKKAIERYTPARVLGYLPKNPDFELPSRALGLVPAAELEDILHRVDLIADSLEKTLDWRQILDLLENQKDLLPPHTIHSSSASAAADQPSAQDTFTVAYAYDPAFHFYYNDNLDALRERGGRLVTFSPLRDASLPPADLYYFGGGYSGLYAEKLSENAAMLASIRKASEAGAVIYAEGSGLVYLCDGFEKNGTFHPFCGVFPGVSHEEKRLQHFGYTRGNFLTDCLLGEKGAPLVGHSFHHEVLETDLAAQIHCQKVREGEVLDSWDDGYQIRNSFGSFLYTHFYQRADFLDSLLAAVLAEKTARAEEKKRGPQA